MVKTKFMKRIIHLNESQLKDLIQKVINESKKDKKFIQKAVKKQEEKGTSGKFGEWCRKNGLASEEGKVTMKCINKAMKSEDSKVIKMANFAKNIGGFKGSQKEMAEDIDPSELEIGKSYQYPHPDPTEREPMEYEASYDDYGSIKPNSKIYKFKKGKGAAIFTDVTPIQKYPG